MNINRIKIARELNGLEQKELAYQINVSQPTISNWETGRKQPTLDNLRSLSNLLSVSIDYLVGISPFPGILERENDHLVIQTANPIAITPSIYGLSLSFFAWLFDLTQAECDEIVIYHKKPPEYLLDKVIDYFEFEPSFRAGYVDLEKKENVRNNLRKDKLFYEYSKKNIARIAAFGGYRNLTREEKDRILKSINESFEDGKIYDNEQGIPV